MRLFSAFLSGFLGLIMMAATLLPTLHALEHELDSQTDNYSQIAKITKTAIDCELCDFTFSSIDTPVYLEYDFHLRLKESVFSISMAETVYLYSQNNFSLRAPPAVTV